MKRNYSKRFMYFEHIMDSRFEGGNTKEKFDTTLEKIINDLNALSGVTAKAFEPYKLEWDGRYGEDDSYQWRAEIHVTKDGRKTTWDDVYDTINKTKSEKYRFSKPVYLN